jgi:hypothetical protein
MAPVKSYLIAAFVLVWLVGVGCLFSNWKWAGALVVVCFAVLVMIVIWFAVHYVRL